MANALRSEVTSTVLEPLGLAFPQYICMRILSKFPDRSNAELARDTNVSPQAMNMVLRGLAGPRPGHAARERLVRPVTSRRS